MRRRGSAPSISHQKRSRPRKRWGSGLWRDIGSSPREIKRHGVALKPRAVSASERVVRFADGSELAVDGVIWATGYQPDYSWIRAPVLDPKGLANHRRGVTDVPGLYFLGLTWQHTRGSALIGFVKDDAEFIAEQALGAATSQVPASEHVPTGAVAKGAG